MTEAQFTEDDVKRCREMAEHFDTLAVVWKRRLQYAKTAASRLRSEAWNDLADKIEARVEATEPDCPECGRDRRF